MLAPGQNPRHALRRHRERGPKAFTYTRVDICLLAAISPSTLKRAQRSGDIKPSSLASVVRWLAPRLQDTP